MKKKLLVLMLSATVASSLIACGSTSEETPASASQTEESSAESSVENSVEETTEKAEGGDTAASIDFEDDVFGFAGMASVKANADASELSIVDYNGSKALKVDVQSKVPYLALNLDGLLGEDIAKVKTIEMEIGIDNGEDGDFYANSGRIYAYSGEDLNESYDEWSVYMEKTNPKKVSATIEDSEAFVAGAGNYIIITKETDNAQTAIGTPVDMYIDNISFLDADGNVLAVDKSAVYVAADSGKDYSNIAALTGAVEFEGFVTSADGWAQSGFTMPQEIIDALVPGAVVEIDYKSENGDMWIVMNEAEAGWNRCGDGNNGSAYINNSKNVAQITYEQLAAVFGEDVSTWGSTMQCEASGAWEVYGVRVGQKAPVYTLSNAVEFAGFTTSGDGWAQNGFAMPQEIIDALVPGSAVEISFSSENNDMWIVMNEAAAGWNRCGDGNNGSAVIIGDKAYITYEQLAAVFGEDVSTWGSTMQCEASGAWEVYGVRVGTLKEMKMLSNVVNFEGFATSGDGWAQSGFTMPQEIIDALVPGSVVTISYTSENNDMWIVMNEAEAGWNRCGDNGNAACSNGVCQVTFEQLAEVFGEDPATWGSTMQCEASGAWEVYSVGVGVAAQ